MIYDNPIICKLLQPTAYLQIPNLAQKKILMHLSSSVKPTFPVHLSPFAQINAPLLDSS